MKSKKIDSNAKMKSGSACRNIVLATVLTFAASIPAFAQTASPGVWQCAALKGRIFGPNSEAKVSSADMPNLLGLPLDQHCNVSVQVLGSDLIFTLSLPVKWNKKLLALGGGGFDGDVQTLLPPVLTAQLLSPSAGREGYAIMANNGGHASPLPGVIGDGFGKDEQKLRDYFGDAAHRSLPLAEEIVKAYYGGTSEKKYFYGCSKGGEEAMIEAQKYPKDFDGIVAQSPTGNLVGQFMVFNRIAKRASNPWDLFGVMKLDEDKRNLLANAVLNKCDGNDGLNDGVISNPAACKFNVADLQCKSVSEELMSKSCLTRAQVETVNAVTSPFTTSDGSVFHAGYYPGGENSKAGWGGGYILPDPPVLNLSGGRATSEAFIQGVVATSSKIDALSFNADDWLPRLKELNRLGGKIEPDLSGLLKRKGKLLMYNGTIDTSASAKDNSIYYDNLVAKMGKEKTDQVVEFFQAPGDGHCAGAPDLLQAVSKWVEDGVPPSRQKLERIKNASSSTPAQSRPLCKYPAYPRYQGGDVNAAASFKCEPQEEK